MRSMALSQARLFAQILIEQVDENPIEVELPNDGFSDDVVKELQRMGCLVERQNQGQFERIAVHLAGPHARV